MTTGDWDFDNELWDLDSSVYVSAPSSLHLVKTVEHGQIHSLGLVKTTVVPIVNVKEGRVVTQLRIQDVTGTRNDFRIIFRYQDVDNYYFVNFGHTLGTTIDISVWCRKEGVETQIGDTEHSAYHAYQQFNNLRVTWWNDYVGLVIRVEVWNGSAWDKVTDEYHTANEWKDVGGRVGLRLGSYSYFPVGSGDTYVDDTEIYGIPP